MSYTLYQGLIVHADGRCVADLVLDGTVVRGLHLSQSAAAGGAGWRDLTGRIVFPGPVILQRAAGAQQGGMTRHGPPATTVVIPLRGCLDGAPPEPAPAGVDALPLPLLADVTGHLDALPEAVFGCGYAAVAVDDAAVAGGRRSGRARLRHRATGAEAAAWRDLRRLLGHCGATLVVLSDAASTMEAATGGRPVPADGCRLILAPGAVGGMRTALEWAWQGGAGGGTAAVAVPAHLLLDPDEAAAEWWSEVRAGTIRAVSVGSAETAGTGPQLVARLWWAGVASGRVTLEELAALLCWQPAQLLGLPAKGRLYPGCDADLTVVDPEAEVSGEGRQADPDNLPGAQRGVVSLRLRSGTDAGVRPGRWIRGVPVREPL